MDLLRDSLTKSDRKRQKVHYVTFMWNLKYDTNEVIYKVETSSQMQKTNLWFPKGKGGAGIN